jgi:hypothetical protein
MRIVLALVLLASLASFLSADEKDTVIFNPQGDQKNIPRAIGSMLVNSTIR